MRYEVDMREVRRGKLVLGIADGRVFADDICVYIARDMRVALIAPTACPRNDDRIIAARRGCAAD